MDDVWRIYGGNRNPPEIHQNSPRNHPEIHQKPIKKKHTKINQKHPRNPPGITLKSTRIPPKTNQKSIIIFGGP
jgi:hypothetical protein